MCYIPYDLDFYRDNTAILSVEYLSNHLVLAILGNHPEWMLTIRKVIRDLLLDRDPSHGHEMQTGLKTLLMVIAKCFEQMIVTTLT